MKLKVWWLVSKSGSPYPGIFEYDIRKYARENNIRVTEGYDPPSGERWGTAYRSKGVVTFEGDDINKLLYLSRRASQFCREMESLSGFVPLVTREFLGEDVGQINLLLRQIDRLKNGAGAAARELKGMRFWSRLRRKKIVETSKKLEELLNTSL